MNYICGILPEEEIRFLGLHSVFVFGSNRLGIHGAGAAKTAWQRFGAVYGVGQGHEGQSFALPTKSTPKKTLSLAEIGLEVEKLRVYVEKNTNLYFLITKIGCGFAGYTPEQVAPLFRPFLWIGNCAMPREFIEILLKTD
jgi:hypothetical protein